jgi:hypothetical protein
MIGVTLHGTASPAKAGYATAGTALVCTENLVRVDDVTKSPKLAG